MKTALKVMSIISIVIGSLSIISSAEGGVDAGYALIGGAFYLTQGILALVYINQQTKA